MLENKGVGWSTGGWVEVGRAIQKRTTGGLGEVRLGEIGKIGLVRLLSKLVIGLCNLCRLD